MAPARLESGAPVRPVTPYRAAIDHTTRTIDRRARYFRNQIIVVVALGVLALVLGIVVRPGFGVTALLLVPACGLFLYADGRALSTWRRALIASWAAADIDLVAFRASIRAHPALPPGTTEAMLSTLPELGELGAEQTVFTHTRRAIAATALELDIGRADALLLRVAASAIVVLAILVAVVTGRWMPLMILWLLAVLPVAGFLRRRTRRARRNATLASCRSQPGFSEADYQQVTAKFPLSVG